MIIHLYLPFLSVALPLAFRLMQEESKKTKEVLIWMVLVDHPPVPAIFECCSPTCFQADAGREQKNKGSIDLDGVG